LKFQQFEVYCGVFVRTGLVHADMKFTRGCAGRLRDFRGPAGHPAPGQVSR
jgi:hypothetical protein